MCSVVLVSERYGQLRVQGYQWRRVDVMTLSPLCTPIHVALRRGRVSPEVATAIRRLGLVDYVCRIPVSYARGTPVLAPLPHAAATVKGLLVKDTHFPRVLQ